MANAWRDSREAKRFYRGKQWQRVRDMVWSRAHGLCEKHAMKKEVKPADVVHHKIPLNSLNYTDPDVSLNPDRLMALCHDCHAEEHQRLGIGALGHEYEEPRVMFDSEGNVVRKDG